MLTFYKVVKLRVAAGELAKCVLLKVSRCEVVGSGCELGLPRTSPHSSTYHPLTLASSISSLNNAWLEAGGSNLTNRRVIRAGSTIKVNSRVGR